MATMGWFITWLDYGTPQLHNSGWLFALVVCFLVDVFIKWATDDA